MGLEALQTGSTSIQATQIIFPCFPTLILITLVRSSGFNNIHPDTTAFLACPGMISQHLARDAFAPLVPPKYLA